MTVGPPDIIVLMGLRASGKSALGRALAARLGRAFIDLDDRTRAAFAGATVTDVFARQGEAAWRAAETAALRETLREGPSVLALGGGTPTAPGAAALLEAAQAEGRATCILLDADAALLRARRARPDDRPPLADGEKIDDEIARTMAERLPIFRALADLVLPMGDEPAAATADRLLARWSAA